MGTRNAVPKSVHMQEALPEVDLVPAKRDDFGNSEPVPIHQRDQGGIPRSVTPDLTGRLRDSLYLARRQMFPRSALAIRNPLRRANFTIFGYWGPARLSGHFPLGCYLHSPINVLIWESYRTDDPDGQRLNSADHFCRKSRTTSNASRLSSGTQPGAPEEPAVDPVPELAEATSTFRFDGRPRRGPSAAIGCPTARIRPTSPPCVGVTQ
jgi:hypothetical protein